MNLEIVNFSKDKYRKNGSDKTCKKCKTKQRKDRMKDENRILPEQKKCSQCKETLSKNNFCKNKSNCSGLNSECKKCGKINRLERKQKNINNVLPDNYTKLCKTCNTQKTKGEYYKNIYSSDGIGTACITCEKKRHVPWNSRNPSKKAEYRSREYFKNYQIRRESNPQFKLSGNIRNRIRMALKRQEAAKFNNTFELIDCSPNFLKIWIENQFNSDMSWNNYGLYWNIDHVIPCSFFDLKKREEQLKCFNWKNCRPMKSLENNLKNDKIQPFQILLQEIKVHYYERHIQIAGIS